MKKIIPLAFFAILISSTLLFSQDNNQGTTNHPDHIKGGFYLKLGAVLPVGAFASGQNISLTNTGFTPPRYTLNYLPAKIGPAMDMGFIIYLGPSFANNYLRAGIDATFMSFWFNSTNPVDANNRYEHYYYFIGQKFGPVITVNPIDRLMVDLSYKINANASYHYDEWQSLANAQYSKYGINLWGQEVSMNIRYRIILFGVEYNFGTMTYDNIDSSKPDQKIQISTTRILVGFKF